MLLFDYPPTVVIRHRLEKLKKCSLRGLESRSDFNFLTYPYTQLPPLTGYILLKLDAPPLTRADANCGLLVLDATWRYAAKMLRPFEERTDLIPRSLPLGYQTAYPRRQLDCPEPGQGLSSVEAIYISYVILGRNPAHLLDHYHWKDSFLEKNLFIN
jgi:pre-rRNA-processing protein TSR3